MLSSFTSSPLGEAVMVGLTVAVAVALIAVAAVAVVSMVATFPISAPALVVGAVACVAVGVLAGVLYGALNSGTDGGASTGAVAAVTVEDPPDAPPEPEIEGPSSLPDKRKNRWILRFLPSENGENMAQTYRCDISIQTEGVPDSKFTIDEKELDSFYREVEARLSQWLDERESYDENGTFEVFIVREPDTGKPVLTRIEKIARQERGKRNIRLLIGTVSAISPSLQ